GVVDAADYTVWRDSLGQGATAFWPGNRDPSNTGAVNLADYFYWRNHFGSTRFPGFAPGAVVAPEPDSMLLLALLGALARLQYHTRDAMSPIAPPFSWQPPDWRARGETKK
ncbi:MAG: hypothetical protein KDA37_08620, partial [Planctomycetales bacterium]|nr:hypothetical protein [Planctomycetales bacterium]